MLFRCLSRSRPASPVPLWKRHGQSARSDAADRDVHRVHIEATAGLQWASPDGSTREHTDDSTGASSEEIGVIQQRSCAASTSTDAVLSLCSADLVHHDVRARLELLLPTKEVAERGTTGSKSVLHLIHTKCFRTNYEHPYRSPATTQARWIRLQLPARNPRWKSESALDSTVSGSNRHLHLGEVLQ
jgi:hypothetical protein